MNRIGLLTYHHIPNNGAALFAYSLRQALAETFPDHKVGILDYYDKRMKAYEVLKSAKPYRYIPSFKMARRRVFARFQRQQFILAGGLRSTGSEAKLKAHLGSPAYAAWVTGMDVWNIGAVRWLPPFPNPYWLPWEGEAKKIAYAVSGYRSDDRAVERERERIGVLLANFDLIGVRDSYTEEMVRDALGGNDERVVRVPDPTFMYEVRESGVAGVLAEKDVEVDVPILGILVFGKDDLSRQLREHFKTRGYQLAALSMYNPIADVNLGHVLDPHQWAQAFQYFNFCITDRFHGAIFCLKSGIPFITIEPEPLASLRHSKLRDLLQAFDLLDCYFDPHQPDFRIESLLERAGELERDWGRLYRPRVEKILAQMQSRSREYLGQIKSLVSG